MTQLAKMQEQMTRSLFAPIDPVTQHPLLRRDAYVIPNCCNRYMPRVPNRLFGVEINEHGEAI